MARPIVRQSATASRAASALQRWHRLTLHGAPYQQLARRSARRRDVDRARGGQPRRQGRRSGALPPAHAAQIRARCARRGLMRAVATERRGVWRVCRRARGKSRRRVQGLSTLRAVRRARRTRAPPRPARRSLILHETAQGWLATRSCARWCAAPPRAEALQAARVSAALSRALTVTFSRPPRRQSARCSPPPASVRPRAARRPVSACLLTSRASLPPQASSWPSTPPRCSSWSACATASAAW